MRSVGNKPKRDWWVWLFGRWASPNGKAIMWSLLMEPDEWQMGEHVLVRGDRIEDRRALCLWHCNQFAGFNYHDTLEGQMLLRDKLYLWPTVKRMRKAWIRESLSAMNGQKHEQARTYWADKILKNNAPKS